MGHIRRAAKFAYQEFGPKEAVIGGDCGKKEKRGGGNGEAV